MRTNKGNNLHMDCTSTPDNAKLASTTLDVNNDHPIATHLHMNENNSSAPGNKCHKKMKKDFIGSGNVPLMGNTSMNSGCIIAGDQISGSNRNMRAATIPQSIPTISRNSVENISGQMSANGVGLLSGIQTSPANDSHVLKYHVDVARRLQSDGQTPPRPSQRYANVSAGLPQHQQLQQGSRYFSDLEDNINIVQMNNEWIRYRNDQSQTLQLQQQNIMCDPVGFQMEKSRCNMTAMQPSNYPIEPIPQPLQYLYQQQSTVHATESIISHDIVQCDALDLRIRQPWSPARTHIAPNVMSMQHQLVQSAHMSSNSQPNPTPRTSTSILDLNDDCLIEICQELDGYDLYRLRESHNRFAFATQYCYNKMDSEKSFEFDFRRLSGDPGNGDFVKILEYFGDCMTRVRIDEFFTRFVREKCISQSFLAERLKNVRFLRLCHAGHNEVEFLSALEHIQEFILEGVSNWMPLHVRWSHLNQLHVIMQTLTPAQFHRDVGENKNGSDQIIAFLMEHKGIQKLSIEGEYLINHAEKLCEKIATHTSELIELDLGHLFSDDGLESLSTMNALRKLRIGLHYYSMQWFEKFQNLKSLTLTQNVELREVCEIVRRIPSLTHLEIYMLDLLGLGLGLRDDVHVPERNCMILESMIEQRKLSPNCEIELLRIYIAFLRVSCIYSMKEDYYPQPVKRCQKYVEISDWKEGRESFERNLCYQKNCDCNLEPLEIL